MKTLKELMAKFKLGGDTTFKRYGREHMKEIGRKGGKAPPYYLNPKKGYRSWRDMKGKNA